MEPIQIDLSGRRGLVPNYFGDLNDTTSKPHLRYIGQEGQFADGIFNPLKKYGYLSPANNTYLALTEALNANIISTEYDSINDDVYLAEAGNTIWRLDGLDDQSTTAALTINQSGTEILNDINIYEIFGTRVLFYDYYVEGTKGDIGFFGLDSGAGIHYANSVDDDNSTSQGTITGGGSIEALAQAYSSSTAFTFDRVVLPITKGSTDNGGYTMQVDIQKDSWTENLGSYDFDGSNDYLQISDGSHTGLDLTDDFTFELWFKPDTSNDSQDLITKTFSDAETTGAYRFRFDATTKDIALKLTDSGGTVTDETVTYKTVADAWVHLAVSRNKTAGEVKFYVNGLQQGSTQAATTTALLNSNGDFAIGASDSTGGNFVFNASGNIKEVRVWNDVRTQAEISANMHDTLVGNEAGLVAYYPLNSDFLDLTSNNNDLTSANPPTVSTSVPPGIPDGVSIGTSATVSPSSIIVDGAVEEEAYTTFSFGSAMSISANEKFFIILEPTTFGDMGAEDSIKWLGREADTLTNLYPYSNDGTNWNFYTGGDQDKDFDFKLVLSSSQTWLTTLVTDGGNILGTSSNVFMRNADNGFMYIFEDRKVHKIDGGVTGGATGILTENVLIFPSYFTITDALDTRGRMYIAVQSNPLAGVSDVRSYSEAVTGIYLWDRLSTIVGTRDFLPLFGVRDIKSLYLTPDGSVRAICIGDDRFVQIRDISNGGVILERLGLSAYPENRKSIKTIHGMTTWLGADGIFYAHGAVNTGEPEQLFKIGDMSGQATGAFTTGCIVIGDEDSAQSRQSIILAFKDTASSKLSRWYLHGQGSIDSNPQLGNQGNVYTRVMHLPNLSVVRDMVWRCIPTGTGSATIATIKYYFNQSSTVGMTKTVTKDEASRGYLHHQINKPNVNSIQIEIEWSTTETLGTDTFHPSVGVLTFKDTSAVSPDNG